MNRTIALVIAFAISGLAIVTLIACEEETPPPEPVIRPVRYVQVYSTGGARVRTFSGTAHAGVESKLSFKVGGTVLRVGVKVGDRVRAGQLIGELDTRDYELQVQEDIGRTFPNILRAMLRQAPEIILVGEIRDEETAEIAIRAALTGHLVFSTLHTNDAPTAIPRLIDLMNAFLPDPSNRPVLMKKPILRA